MPTHKTKGKRPLQKISSLLLCLCLLSWNALAENNTGASKRMDNSRLQTLIEQIDKDFQGQPGYWQLQIEDTVAAVITDESADRMRIVVQVTPATNLDKGLLYRMMQANFDSALDARYAIANGMVFSTFIHPLGDLSDAGFVSGMAQTVALAHSFGESYSSGALRFEGGDSAAAERELYERIIEQFRSRGESI